MKHLKKQSQHFLVVDTQKTALTSRVDCEGGFCVSAVKWRALTSFHAPGGERSTRRLFRVATRMWGVALIR